MITNIYRIEVYDAIMFEYFCIGFIYFIRKRKSLTDYSLKIYFCLRLWAKWWNNTKIFLITKKMNKLYCVICCKYRKFEKPKILYIVEKH